MAVLEAIKRFVVEKLWKPVTGGAADYNVFNTSIYAAGFAVAAAYIGFPALKKLDISLNREFFLSITPYILMGSAVRVLEDRAIVDSFLMVTPFIYFVMFCLTVTLLAATRYIADEDYYRPFGLIGLAGFLLTVSLYGFSNFGAVLMTLAIFGVTAGAGYLALKKLEPGLTRYSFVIPVAAHYWDASSSVVALFFGGSEKHVLAQFFVDSLGLPGLFVMKTLVVVPAVYYLDTGLEGERRKYYLFLVALLGLALGTRNLLSAASV